MQSDQENIDILNPAPVQGVHKTDTIDAYATFAFYRNLFFGLFLLIPLLLTEICFWLIYLHVATPGTGQSHLVLFGQGIDNTIPAVISACNFILVFSATIYCLILLTGMNLALTGRLGGLADSARGFFLSLIALVLIVPFIARIIPGYTSTLFSFNDITYYSRKLQEANSLGNQISFFGRFCGLWGLSILLLILAQLRSCKATRTIKSNC